MKIHNPIGSKERFLEMFQGVNKVQINELATNVMQTGTQLIDKAFEELRNKQSNVKQTNTQTVGDDNFVEIITNDNEGNEITFRFKVNSTEGDQEGVFNVDNAVLAEFKLKSGTLNVDMPENMQAVQDFNANHGGEIMDVISEYANFETNTASVDDEMYEEAIKFIDKVPYKKGSEQIQTHKAYADQKPTNPDVRVKSDELDKFVSENDEEDIEGEEDILALPPDYSMSDIPKDDDGSIGVDTYGQEEIDDEPIEAVSPEKAAIINQAYDNLIAAGNQAPTTNEIMVEIDKLQGNVKPVEKTRAIPKGAEPFWEGSVVKDFDTDAAIAQSFEKTVSPEMKQKVIMVADEILSTRLGVKKFQMSKEQYVKIVRDLAIQIYRQGAAGMNEETEKSDYPDQIGKKFKPKNQMPKKKKRPQAVVKLSEESEIPQEYWGNPEDELKEEDDKWIQKAVNPEHKGYCTPMTKDTCTPARKALAKRFKKGIDEEPDLDFNNIGAGIGGNIAEEDVEQVEKEKEEVGDVITGGKADKKKPQDFDKEEIKMGLKVEMEHTDDPMVAIEIAMDHLTEFPDYYTRLDKMEKQAKGDTKSEGLVDNTPEEEELTDELLGFKPHNVGDYADEEFDYAAAERDYHDKEDMRQHPEDYEDTGEEQPEEIIDEEGDMEEYQGEIGDRYQDGEGNQFTVREKVKGGVTLQGQSGEKEIATRDIGFLKKLSENKVVEKEIITEEQVKTARQALNKRGISDGMTKKEAVQILIKHNIK